MEVLFRTCLGKKITPPVQGWVSRVLSTLRTTCAFPDFGLYSIRARLPLTPGVAGRVRTGDSGPALVYGEESLVIWVIAWQANG